MALDPRAQVAFDQGHVFAKANDWVAAVRSFLTCVSFAPDYVNGWYNLMCSHIHNGEREKALGAGQRALAINPKFPNLKFCLANLTSEMDRVSDSVEYFLQAIEDEPQHMQCHILLGNLFEKMKMFEEAYECFDNALRLGGERSTLYSAMIYQAGHSGRFDLAHIAGLGLKREFKAGRNHAAPFQLFCYEASTRGSQLAASAQHWNKTVPANIPQLSKRDS